MNQVVLMGRLCNTPESRYYESKDQDGKQKVVTRFRFAVNRQRKGGDGQPEADFVDVVTFGKTAEIADKYLAKGMKILISGEIRNNNYVNREGKQVYQLQIVANNIEFAEPKKEAQRAAEIGQSVNDFDVMGGMCDFEELPLN